MNKNSQMILSESDIITAWLSDKQINQGVFDDLDPICIYNDWCKQYDIDDTINAKKEYVGDDFAENCLKNWYMPENYVSINIYEWLIEKCSTAQQRDRVYNEIAEYEKRGMIIVLKFLRYLVDVCEENNIVLGVGRGSSVSSYCLFLLGVHRVDSLKYKLDIKEFLK